MRKSILLSLLSLVLLPPLSAGQKPDTGLPYVGSTLSHVPAANRFALKEITNPETREAYWLCRGLTTFTDGTQTTRFEYRAPFYTRKERKEKRRKVVKECLNWLDHAEEP